MMCVMCGRTMLQCSVHDVLVVYDVCDVWKDHVAVFSACRAGDV